MPPTDGRSGPTRATPRVLLIVAGALLAARIALGVWDVASPDSRPELVTWHTFAEAQRSPVGGRRLMLYAFTDPRQRASRNLARDVFKSASLAGDLDRQFVSVRIEGTPDQDLPEEHALRARFGVTELPALVVATPDGERYKTIAGYHDAHTTMAALKNAQLEVMGLPFTHGGGFQFRVGGRDSADRGPFERGRVGGSGSDADSIRSIGPR
jgi:hypothetical protein